jgi:TnpA family transposase
VEQDPPPGSETRFACGQVVESLATGSLRSAESERLVGVLVARTRAPLARFSERNFSPAQYGRIFKTLHILNYIDDDPYRREIKAIRKLQEGRHDLGRTAFHGRKGELRHGYRDGMKTSSARSASS